MGIEHIVQQLSKDRLALDERETTFTQTADNRHIWHVFSNDEVWIRRLMSKGAELLKYDEYGATFRLEGNQVRIFQPLTDEQRRRMAASLPTTGG